MRITYAVLAILSVVAGAGDDGAGATVRNVATAVMAGAAAAALAVSIVRRRAGVRGMSAVREARVARVSAMLGRPARSDAAAEPPDRREFDPRVDLLSPAAGLVALVGAAAWGDGPFPLNVARLVVGALFLGAVTDAMLLGHWYLVQPGLGREPIRELVRAVVALWPLELLVYLLPTGMVSVLSGSIDDGYGGLIGWMWVVASLTTIALAVATWYALKERSYSAVMAATGLLYLAILTGFGMDLLPRALLA
jgi:hypothetical protein